MRGSMDVFGATDVGRKRPNNEDHFFIADLNRSMKVHQTSLGLDHQTRLFGNSQAKVLAVADGMGGQAAGERASGAAIDAMVLYLLNTMHWLFQLDETSDDNLLDDLKATLEHCQSRLRAESTAMPDRQGMGTTLTLAYLIWPRLYTVHVGDSRCYLFRSGRLEQLTRDHTLAERLVEQGALAKEEVAESRWRHVLWNVIGGDSDPVYPEVCRADLKIGDTVLVCSDGLTKHVSDARIRELLGRSAGAEETCQQLVRTANEAGGSDNVTVVVARFLETSDSRELAAQRAETETPEGEARRLKDTDPHLPAVEAS